MLPDLLAARRGPVWAGWILALSLLVIAPSALGAPWTRVGVFDGVSVSSRQIPGQDMPEFRGVAVVDANLFQVMAVIDDADRHCEWMARCAESRVVKQLKGFDRVLYQRLDAPWPVADRDLVVRGSIRIDRDRRLVVSSFRSVNLRGMPPREGVVRVTALKGFYRLKQLKDGKTRVLYQVYSDPGGSLPRWLARKATKKIPAETITSLRRQLSRTQGEYEDFLDRYDPERGGEIPKVGKPRH